MKAKPDIAAVLNRGYRFAIALTHDPERAEDLVQEAWLKIIRRKPQEWNVGYLFAAIKHLHIDETRRKRLELVENADALGSAVPLNIDDDTLFDISTKQLEDALGKIRSDQREILFLMCVEDYTAAEVAEHLQKPRGTVLSLAHRAKEKLKNILAPYRERGVL